MYPMRARYLFANSFLSMTQLVAERTGLKFGERIILMEIAEMRLRYQPSRGTNMASLAVATGFSRCTISAWVQSMTTAGWVIDQPTGLDVADWGRLFKLYAEAVPKFCRDLQEVREALPTRLTLNKPIPLSLQGSEIDALLTQQTLKTFQDVSLTIAEQTGLDPIERLLCLYVAVFRLGHSFEFGPKRPQMAKATGLPVSQVNRRIKMLCAAGALIETPRGFDITSWGSTLTMVDAMLDRALTRMAHLIEFKETTRMA
jgi:hypothetical protein